MDLTESLTDNLAETNVGLIKRWAALPRVVWYTTCGLPYQPLRIVAKGRRDRLHLLAGTLFMSLVLLIASGCAAAQNAVSPAPTLSEGSGAFIAELTPEGPNTHGTGTARLQLSPEQQRICFVIHVANIELPTTAAHIHKGAAGTNGPIVVHLEPPNAQGISTGCTHTPRTVIAAIMQHPGDYYVNVHNKPYPDGVVRGQIAVCTSHVIC
jgi:CHRD domain